jgi:iron complex transport system ATP-binding protein
LLDKHILNQIPLKELAKMISIVLTGRIQASHLTVWELLAISRAPYTDWLGRLSEKDKEIIHKSIELTNIQALIHHSLDTLSDGEHQKSMIARAFVQNTPFVLLDEPTAHLDITNKLAVFQLLQKLAHQENKGILISTHEMYFALQYADEIWLMHEGQFYQGLPTDIHLLQLIEKAFGVQDLLESMDK